MPLSFDGPHELSRAPISEYWRGLLVEIHIPDAIPSEERSALDAIRNATAAFLAEFDFEPDPYKERVEHHASWHWKQWFKRIHPHAKKEAAEVYDEIKEALRREHIDSVGASAFKDRATAASELIKTLEPYENAIVRLGDVVVAKANVDGQHRLVVETISPKISRQLEDNPALIRDPHAFIQHIESVDVHSASEEDEPPLLPEL